MSQPTQIELRYKANSDGTLEISVNPMLPGVNVDYVWQYCPAGTANWAPVGTEGREKFFLSKDALNRYGDKYRCLGYIGNKVEYYSKVLTVSSKTQDFFWQKSQSQTSGEGQSTSDSKYDSFYQRWQQHEEEQKRWEKEQRQKEYEDSYREEQRESYEEKQKRWREEEETRRQQWREEQSRWSKTYSSQSSSGEYNFFQGCDDWESVEARYRRLMMAYHPDHKGGDENTAKILNKQYEELKQRYGK